MRAGDVAEGIDHHHHDQTERERNADVRDGSSRDVIDYDRAGTCKDESEGTKELGDVFFIAGLTRATG